jgi:lysophospholipase L1-like esterase
MKSTLILPVVASLALGVFSSSLPARAQAAADNDFFFKEGDTPIVFLGDSITEQRMYTTLLESYLLTRFPNRKMEFRNAGWGGDTAWLRQRGGKWEDVLDRDVLSFHPKAVTIDFGMNDARGGDGTYQQYIDFETKLVDAIKASGSKVALIPSSPEEKYEAGKPAGSDYNNMLQKYADALKAIATKENVPFADQYTPFVATIESGRKADLLSATEPPKVRLIPDSVHPNWGGHLIMASSILQGLHAPALVSSATIDGAAQSTTSLEGCKVDMQKTTDGSIAFARTDDALPWAVPGDPMVDVALKIPGFDPGTTLNKYMLTVTGLKEPSYTLSIDGVDVGSYPASDLAAGVNLGFLRKGPIFDQTQKLVQTIIAKNNDYMSRWRAVQLAGFPGWVMQAPGFADAQKAEEARLDKSIADQEATIETLRKPVSHVFKLVPAAAAPAAK